MGGSSIDSEKRHGKRKKSKNSGSGATKKIKSRHVGPAGSDKGSDSENEQEYIVENILDKKMVDGEWRYYIKWLGWPSETNTWEPVENLNGCPEMLERFEEDWTEKRAAAATAAANIEKKPKPSSESAGASKNIEEKTFKVRSEKKAHTLKKEKDHEPDERKKDKTLEKAKADDDEPEGEGLVEKEALDILEDYPEGRVPQKIIGVVPIGEILVYCIEWKPASKFADKEPVSLIRGETFKEKFPEMIIKFYEEHIVWAKDAKGESKLFDEADAVRKGNSSSKAKENDQSNGVNDSGEEDNASSDLDDDIGVRNVEQESDAESDHSDDSGESKENYQP